MQNLVELHANKPVTTTLKVAEFFGKDHKNVLRDVKSLLSQASEIDAALNFERCSSDQSFFDSNFKETSYIGENGKTLAAYEMTKSGFALLAMGFTGPKALQFKVGYINAFDEMESKLKQTQTKELLRLSNIESAWEKSERAYVELDHTVHNKYDSLIAEVKNLKLAVAEERKDVRDQLIDEKAEKLFSTWKRQLGKIWAERFKIIQENLLAIEKRYAKLHQFHDLDIERFISRALHETGAAVPD
jgi:Rha family phage regulatory protein